MGLVLLLSSAVKLNIDILAYGIGVEKFILLEVLSSYSSKAKLDLFGKAAVDGHSFLWAHHVMRNTVMHKNCGFAPNWGYLYMDSIIEWRNQDLERLTNIPRSLLT